MEKYLALPKFSAMVDLMVSITAAILGGEVYRVLEYGGLMIFGRKEQGRRTKDLGTVDLCRILKKDVALLSLSVIVRDDVTSSDTNLRIGTRE